MLSVIASSSNKELSDSVSENIQFRVMLITTCDSRVEWKVAYELALPLGLSDVPIVCCVKILRKCNLNLIQIIVIEEVQSKPNSNNYKRYVQCH